MENNEITITERKITIARLEVQSPELHFSSGNDSNEYTRDQMIDHIKLGDEVGNDFVKTEFEFLRALKNGTLMNMLVEA
jgi:hypothetical protein